MEVEIESYEPMKKSARKKSVNARDSMEVEYDGEYHKEREQKKNRISANTNTQSTNTKSTLKEREQIAEKAIDLIFNNKINAKNAFDVNVEFLESLPHFLNKNEESAWNKASASLDASAKIYGYRVDCVHSDTFRFLGGLNRTDNKEEDAETNEKEIVEEEKRRKKQEGACTIEKDVSKLDLEKYELEYEIDYLFKNMTARFNEGGAKGLLLNNLLLDSNLDILLESKEKEKQITNVVGLTEDIKAILQESLGEINMEELSLEPLCPDLTYFKRDTAIKNTAISEIEQSFIEVTAVREDKMIVDSEAIDVNEEPINIAESEVNDIEREDEFPDVEMNEEGEENNFSPDNKTDDKNMQNNNHHCRVKIPPKQEEDLGFLKNDNLKNYLENFGDGGKEFSQTLPEMKNLFSANYLKNFIKPSIPATKPKKEETTIFFDIHEKVDRNDIFELKKPSQKKTKETVKISEDNLLPTHDKKTKKLFIHYNRTSSNDFLFQFANQDKSYFKGKEDTLPEVNEEEDGAIKVEDEFIKPDLNFDVAIDYKIENTARVDKDYEKHFGRLYKTFDVRFLKGKIWESLKENQEDCDFRKLISTVSKNVGADVKKNISSQTCFVCLLHLANEKGNYRIIVLITNILFPLALDLALEEAGQDNFSITY